MLDVGEDDRQPPAWRRVILMPEPLTPIGFVAAVAAWIGLICYLSTIPECVRFSLCTSGDIFLSNIVAAGMVAPAWIVGQLVGLIFRKD